MVQYLMGHGDFASKLHSLGLKDNPLCSCGRGNEDAEHVIFDCSNTSKERNILIRTTTEAGYNWPCDISTFIKTRGLFKSFRKFAKATLLAKKQGDVEL